MSSAPDKSKTRVVVLPNSLSALAFTGSTVLLEVFIHPFNTIKTRLQSSEGFWKTGGFRNAYRGFCPAALSRCPSLMVFQYGAQSSINPNNTQVEAMLSLGIGAFAATIVGVPFEVVKQRRQTEATPTKQLVKNAFRNEGIFGIYRGFWSTAFLNCTSVAVTLSMSEFVRYIYFQSVRRPLLKSEQFASAVVGGSLAALLLTPLDVGKTRIMLYKLSENEISSSRRVPSLISTLRSIYHEDGFKRIFSGGSLRAFIAPAEYALSSMIYVYSVLAVGILYVNLTDKESDD